MRHLRPLPASAREERGQMLIFFVGVFTIIAIAAAIAVDFGLWFSERRGAQRDADLITLAGAYELLDETAEYDDVDLATQQTALLNNLDPALGLHNLQVKSLAFPAGYDADEEYCANAPDTGGRLNAVSLNTEHQSKALFASIFGLSAPEIGAYACARVGSLHGTRGLRPWVVSMYNSECFDWVDTNGDRVKSYPEDEFVPLFGQDCVFRLESPSSQVGSVRLGDEDQACSGSGTGGARQYRDNIEYGAGAWCEIGDMVDTQPGLDTGPTLMAIEDLLAGEGECDALNGNPTDGIDQFSESFEATSPNPSPDTAFVERDCTTPRAVHIIIMTAFDGQGFDSQPLEGIAAFFLQQCEEVDGDGNVLAVYEKCDVQGGGQASFQVRGFFMSILELEGEIGDFNTFGTNVIRLVE